MEGVIIILTDSLSHWKIAKKEKMEELGNLF